MLQGEGHTLCLESARLETEVSAPYYKHPRLAGPRCCDHLNRMGVRLLALVLTIMIRAGAIGTAGTAMAVPTSQKVGPCGTSKTGKKKF